MRTVTGAQMLQIVHYAQEGLEISQDAMLEHAALRILQHIDLRQRHSFGIFCGEGLSGRLGLVLARCLSIEKKHVHVFWLGEKKDATIERYHRILERLQVSMHHLQTLGDIEDMIDQLSYLNTLIDGLLGVELDHDVRGLEAVVIEQMNASRIYTISLDIPSGLHPDTGRYMAACVEPHEIMCLEYMKAGLADNPFLRCPIHQISLGIPELAARRILGGS